MSSFLATFAIAGIEKSGDVLDPCSYLVTHSRLYLLVLYVQFKVCHRVMESILHSLVQKRHPMASPRLLFTSCSLMV